MQTIKFAVEELYDTLMSMAMYEGKKRRVYVVVPGKNTPAGGRLY